MINYDTGWSVADGSLNYVFSSPFRGTEQKGQRDLLDFLWESVLFPCSQKARYTVCVFTLMARKITLTFCWSKHSILAWRVHATSQQILYCHLETIEPGQESKNTVLASSFWVWCMISGNALQNVAGVGFSFLSSDKLQPPSPLQKVGPALTLRAATCKTVDSKDCKTGDLLIRRAWKQTVQEMCIYLCSCGSRR